MPKLESGTDADTDLMVRLALGTDANLTISNRLYLVASANLTIGSVSAFKLAKILGSISCF
jgi:hypothetical protein